MILKFDDGSVLSQLIVFEKSDVQKFLSGEKYFGTTWYAYTCSDVLFRQEDRIGVYVNVHRSWDCDGSETDKYEYLLL